MKHYSLPAFVLLFASALLLFGIVHSFARASRAHADLAAARDAADQASLELIAAQRAAAATKVSGAPADRFLASWKQELEAESNIEHIFGRLDTLAVNNLLSPSGKNFTLNPNYFFGGHHMAVENVNITVAGDYYRTLNWLGAVESAFPLGRVEQVYYTSSGNSLSLAVQFVFPRTFETP